MEWLKILPLLACPLMMIFCMKGMFTGHKHTDGKENTNGLASVSAQELQSLQIKMADLIEQNHHLSKEVHSLKQSQTTKESNNIKENSVNVVN
ncbi:DUF2933 domain-containing protein [Paenibacillus chondroitinus]|uniref:DUF2933 domain-containing protein n=1 Tax=Paenibacillus chondroitinus TaxID=59842 RepID=A0ABU6DGU4_9BACL|nr:MULTISPECIES: DUF2933 domain-containing protein [Paenibacillus]MCY9659489.1 DUF2933 domain-containing protein [Paenibacillus anseongense]MEB4796884.1 DUF2933 domain-containing protein [Paenibacillus chondroitinus]